jgi:hypothetical protein
MNLTRIFRLHYFILSIFFGYSLWIYQEFIDRSTLVTNWVLLFIPSVIDLKFMFGALCCLGFIASLFACFRPSSRLSRVLVFLIMFLFIPILYAKTIRLFHKEYVFLFSTFFCTLMNIDDKNNKLIPRPYNDFVLWTLQSTLLLPYFLSGLWKLRGYLIFQDEMRDAALFSTLVPRGIIDSALSMQMDPSPIGLYILKSSLTLQFIVSLGALLFELSVLVPIILGSYMRFWGYLIVGFHILSYFTLNISFFPTPLVVFLFLCLPASHKLFVYSK